LVVINLTDFAPSSAFDVTLVHTSAIGTHPDSPWTFPVMTNAAGEAQLVPFSYYQGVPEDASFSASSNGVNSAVVNVSC
jgi:hypothetical protein